MRMQRKARSEGNEVDASPDRDVRIPATAAHCKELDYAFAPIIATFALTPGTPTVRLNTIAAAAEYVAH
jgi:hypothetical protein